MRASVCVCSAQANSHILGEPVNGRASEQEANPTEQKQQNFAWFSVSDAIVRVSVCVCLCVYRKLKCCLAHRSAGDNPKEYQTQTIFVAELCVAPVDSQSQFVRRKQKWAQCVCVNYTACEKSICVYLPFAHKEAKVKHIALGSKHTNTDGSPSNGNCGKKVIISRIFLFFICWF